MGAETFFLPSRRKETLRMSSALDEFQPLRKGRPVCFTIDFDAESLLRAMVPNGNGLGLFLSELIRKEARERVGRVQMLTALSEESRA
jgi:hypothetical protein